MSPKSDQGKECLFPLPPDALNKRLNLTQFVKLDEQLEDGFVIAPEPCGTCQARSVHCTFGNGIDKRGGSRGPGTNKCDLCTVLKKPCSLYNGGQRQRHTSTEDVKPPVHEEEGEEAVQLDPSVAAMEEGVEEVGASEPDLPAASCGAKRSRLNEVL